MSKPDENDTSHVAHDNDRSAADHVEKKPKDKQSPQQTHDNEDQG